MGILSIQPDEAQKQWRMGYRRFAGRISFLRSRMPVFVFHLRLRADTAYRRLVTAWRRRKRGGRV